jgi:predicted ATPase
MTIAIGSDKMEQIFYMSLSQPPRLERSLQRVTTSGWVLTIRLDVDDVDDMSSYPFSIPAVRALASELVLDPAVTFLVGDNGSGKSTLIEAVAVAAGFHPEGGSRNFAFSTRESTSDLHRHLRLTRPPRRPRTGYFLRPESFFNVATQVEQLGADIAGVHGERNLHEQSHGESFQALVQNRFGRDGLYIMDEPEAALSPQGCLVLLRQIHDLVAAGGQFIIATHSPLLIAYPGATVYELGEDGIEPTPFDQAAGYQLFQLFLDAPQRFLRHLFDDM